MDSYDVISSSNTVMHNGTLPYRNPARRQDRTGNMPQDCQSRFTFCSDPVDCLSGVQTYTFPVSRIPRTSVGLMIVLLPASIAMFADPCLR